MLRDRALFFALVVVTATSSQTMAQTVGLQAGGYVYSNHLTPDFPRRDTGWLKTTAQFQLDDEGVSGGGVSTGIHFGASANFQRLTTAASGFANNSMDSGATAGIGSLVGGGPVAQMFDQVTVGGAFSGFVDVAVSMQFDSSVFSDGPNFTLARVSSTFHADGAGNDISLTGSNSTGFAATPPTIPITQILHVRSGDSLRFFHWIYADGNANANGVFSLVHSEFSLTGSSRISFSAPAGVSLLGDSGHQYAPVPEPASILAVGFGVFGILRRRKSLEKQS